MNIEFKISKKPVVYERLLDFLRKSKSQKWREGIYMDFRTSDNLYGGIRFSKNEI